MCETYDDLLLKATTAREILDALACACWAKRHPGPYQHVPPPPQHRPTPATLGDWIKTATAEAGVALKETDLLLTDLLGEPARLSVFKTGR